MILLIHMIFGAAVGYQLYSLTNNIWLAIFSSILSHYFLDFFPHIEYLKSVEDSIKRMKFESAKHYLPDIFKVALDFLMGLFLVFSISNNQPVIYFYALVAIVPDGFTVINLMFKNSVLALHQKIHGDIQYWTKNERFSVFWRISTQVIALLVSIVMLSS